MYQFHSRQEEVKGEEFVSQIRKGMEQTMMDPAPTTGEIYDVEKKELAKDVVEVMNPRPKQDTSRTMGMTPTPGLVAPRDEATHFDRAVAINKSTQTLQVWGSLFKVDNFTRTHFKQSRERLIKHVVLRTVVERIPALRLYHRIKGVFENKELMGLRPDFDLEQHLFELVLTNREMSVPSLRGAEQPRDKDESGGGAAAYDEAREVIQQDSYSTYFMRSDLMRSVGENGKLDPVDKTVDQIMAQPNMALIKRLVNSYAQNELGEYFTPPKTHQEFWEQCQRLLPSAVLESITQAMHFIHRATLGMKRVTVWDIAQDPELEGAFAYLVGSILKQQSFVIQARDHTRHTQFLILSWHRQAKARMLEALRKVREVQWDEVGMISTAGGFQSRLDLWGEGGGPASRGEEKGTLLL